jgi:hypothetical protein
LTVLLWAAIYFVMTNRRALKPALIVTASLLTLGLSCIMPGQYRVYRVANSTTVYSPGCPDLPDLQDTTTFRSGQTFAIFAADTKVYFLDIGAGEGSVTVEGSREGRDYTFEGVDRNVDSDGNATIHSLTVELSIKGRKVEGTSTTEDQVTAPDPYLCIKETDFEGSEMKDVELEHPV